MKVLVETVNEKSTLFVINDIKCIKHVYGGDGLVNQLEIITEDAHIYRFVDYLKDVTTLYDEILEGFYNGEERAYLDTDRYYIDEYDNITVIHLDYKEENN